MCYEAKRTYKTYLTLLKFHDKWIKELQINDLKNVNYKWIVFSVAPMPTIVFKNKLSLQIVQQKYIFRSHSNVSALKSNKICI